jgi:hypothetical protein
MAACAETLGGKELVKAAISLRGSSLQTARQCEWSMPEVNRDRRANFGSESARRNEKSRIDVSLNRLG